MGGACHEDGLFVPAARVPAAVAAAMPAAVPARVRAAVAVHAVAVAGVRIRRALVGPGCLHGRRVVPAAVGIGLHVELAVHRVAQLQLRRARDAGVRPAQPRLCLCARECSSAGRRTRL